MGIWEVKLYISSHCKIKKPFTWKSDKGDDDDPFSSQITLSNYNNGLEIKVEVLEDIEENALDDAFYFIGQALNYMSFIENAAFGVYKNLSSSELRLRKNTKKIIEKDVWEKAFSKGREIQMCSPKLGMSLSWFRKSLNSNDPIDAFLSRWLVIETICNDVKLLKDLKKEQAEDIKSLNFGKYGKGRVYYRIKQKIINEQLENNLDIDFDRLYNIKNQRNEIAHGEFAINDVRTIKRIKRMYVDLEKLAYEFLEIELKKSNYI